MGFFMLVPSAQWYSYLKTKHGTFKNTQYPLHNTNLMLAALVVKLLNNVVKLTVYTTIASPRPSIYVNRK